MNNEYTFVKYLSLDKTSTEKGKIKIGEPISDDCEGGEGKVFNIKSIDKFENNDFVFKKFHDDYIKRNKDKENKIKEMVLLSLKYNIPSNVCWPFALVYENDKFVGYLMKKVKGISLSKIMHGKKTQSELSNYSDADYTQICLSIMSTIEKLHYYNILIGDINEDNFIVKDPKNVFLIDTDSFQFEKFKCNVGRENYFSPTYYETGILDEDSEGYSICILIFKILMLGRDPFTSLLKADLSKKEKVIKGFFPYNIKTDITKKIIYPPLYVDLWKRLSLNLKLYFINIFTRAESYNGSFELINILEEFLDISIKKKKDLSKNEDRIDENKVQLLNDSNLDFVNKINDKNNIDETETDREIIKNEENLKYKFKNYEIIDAKRRIDNFCEKTNNCKSITKLIDFLNGNPIFEGADYYVVTRKQETREKSRGLYVLIPALKLEIHDESHNVVVNEIISKINYLYDSCLSENNTYENENKIKDTKKINEFSNNLSKLKNYNEKDEIALKGIINKNNDTLDKATNNTIVKVNTITKNNIEISSSEKENSDIIEKKDIIKSNNFDSKNIIKENSKNSNYSNDNGMILSNIRIGYKFKFGKYADKPIVWKVLDCKDCKALIIPDNIIDFKIFDLEKYEYSEIRYWLNDEFLYKAFSSSEKDCIEITKIIVNKKTNDFIYDKLFLLSEEELCKYFTTKKSRIVALTPFAKKIFSKERRIAILTRSAREILSDQNWRIRNLNSNVNLTYVTKKGKIAKTKYSNIMGIRPACWIKFKKTTDGLVKQKNACKDKVALDKNNTKKANSDKINSKLDDEIVNKARGIIYRELGFGNEYNLSNLTTDNWNIIFNDLNKILPMYCKIEECIMLNTYYVGCNFLRIYYVSTDSDQIKGKEDSRKKIIRSLLAYLNEN